MSESDTTNTDQAASEGASGTGDAPHRARRVPSVRLTLAAGLTLMCVALGVVLARAPLTVAGTNNVPANFAVTFIEGGRTSCQPGGTVPQGTTAIRVSLSVNIGPRVAVKVLAGSTLVTEGAREAGWGVDETVTVPVRRVPRTVRATRVCTTIGPAVEAIQVNGVRVRTQTGQAIVLRMEYLRPGPSSWLSLASSVADHFGVAHAPSGSWVAYVVIAVMIALFAFTSRVALRGLR